MITDLLTKPLNAEDFKNCEKCVAYMIKLIKEECWAI